MTLLVHERPDPSPDPLAGAGSDSGAGAHTAADAVGAGGACTDPAITAWVAAVVAL